MFYFFAVHGSINYCLILMDFITRLAQSVQNLAWKFSPYSAAPCMTPICFEKIAIKKQNSTKPCRLLKTNKTYIAENKLLLVSYGWLHFWIYEFYYESDWKLLNKNNFFLEMLPMLFVLCKLYKLPMPVLKSIFYYSQRKKANRRSNYILLI